MYRRLMVNVSSPESMKFQKEVRGIWGRGSTGKEKKRKKKILIILRTQANGMEVAAAKEEVVVWDGERHIKCPRQSESSFSLLFMRF